MGVATGAVKSRATIKSHPLVPLALALMTPSVGA
jgi:hypothetical protein